MREIFVLSSIRFFLIFYIVLGHFIQFGTGNESILGLCKQHNMVVGAFFVLSGFLLAGSALRRSEVETKDFFRRRLARIYPTYCFVMLLFSAMFIAIDRYYGESWSGIAANIAIVLSLSQAWVPDWGLLWNSPTWFLSSLAFCYLIFPFSFRIMRRMTERQLWLLVASLFCSLVMIRVLYSARVGWLILEGVSLKKEFFGIFNLMRFNPVINSVEFFIGAAVGILNSGNELREETQKTSKLNGASLIFLLMVALFPIRAFLFPLNDLLSRTFIFIPLFLCWLVHVSNNKPDWLMRFLGRPLFVYLGKVSFSMFILHGALGQLFFKRAVRVLLGLGRPQVDVGLFTVYVALLFFFSALIYHVVEVPVARYLEKRAQPL